MARCLLIIYKHTRTTIRKNFLFFPTLLSPKAFLEFFKEAFFLCCHILPWRPLRGAPKATAYSQVSGFLDLNKKTVIPEELMSVHQKHRTVTSLS
jgi:hypothetical protein